jgi:hypothetical protein
MKWFKHDSDANQDAKLQRLRLRYGMAAYGLYWFLIELIARGVDRDRLTFDLEHDSEIIAALTGISRDMVEDMMRFMVELRLFESANGVITCLKLANRTDEYTAKLVAASRGNLAIVPTVSRQDPDSVDTKSALLDKTRTDQKRKESSPDGESPPPAATDPAAPRVSVCPYDQIVALYHQILCPPMPRVLTLSDARKASLKARWRNELPELEDWARYFKRCSTSPFLTGQTRPQQGRRVFVADFDFLIRPGTPIKVAEGKYHEDAA